MKDFWKDKKSMKQLFAEMLEEEENVDDLAVALHFYMEYKKGKINGVWLSNGSVYQFDTVTEREIIKRMLAEKGSVR